MIATSITLFRSREIYKLWNLCKSLQNWTAMFIVCAFRTVVHLNSLYSCPF